jgi:L-amino acid N-acyltransferase YncA
VSSLRTGIISVKAHVKIIFEVGLMGVELRVMTAGDWEAVRSIYLAGIATGQATFEADAPSWTNWNQSHLPAPRLVAVSNEGVVGWAALSPVSARLVYAGVAEVSVYLSEDMRGLGLGSLLLEALVKESEERGIWTLQAGIFPENTASISLHKSCGFREVGTRRRIGKMNNVWRDTLLFERRSTLVGTD